RKLARDLTNRRDEPLRDGNLGVLDRIVGAVDVRSEACTGCCARLPKLRVELAQNQLLRSNQLVGENTLLIPLSRGLVRLAKLVVVLGFFLAQRVGALENLDLRVIERNASTLQRREPGHGIVQSLAKLDRRAIEVSGGGVTLVERNRHVDHRLGGVREDGLPNVRERQQQVLALLDGAVTSRRNVLEAFGHRPDLLGTDAGLVSGRLDDRSRRSLGFLELEGGI